MKFKFHFAGSVIASAATTGILYSMDKTISTNTLVLCAVAVILGGNFSDCDTKSTPSKIYALMIALTFPILYYADMVLHWVAFIAPFIAAQIWSHRKWTHSIWLVFFLAGLSTVAELISFSLPESLEYIKNIILKFDLQIVCFSLGVLTHLALDHPILKRFGR